MTVLFACRDVALLLFVASVAAADLCAGSSDTVCRTSQQQPLAKADHLLLQLQANGSAVKSLSLQRRLDRSSSKAQREELQIRKALALVENGVRDAGFPLEGLFTSVPMVSGVLTEGLRMIRLSVPLLGKDKRKVKTGIRRLGKALITRVRNLLPESIWETENVLKFVRDWNETVPQLPHLLKKLDFRKFHQLGDVDVCVEAISTVFDQMGTVVQSSLPNTPVKEGILKYLKSLTEVILGVGEGVDLLHEGDSVEAIEAVTAGLMGSVDELVPEAQRTSRTYSEIISGADGEVQGIIKAIFNQQTHALKSKVCWKRQLQRDRVAPQECEEGYALTTYGCFHASTHDMQPPRCPSGSEKRGRWCYLLCPAGYKTRNLHCRQECGGKWEIDGRLMCGRVKGAIRTAIWEMTVGSIRAVFNAEDRLKELRNRVMQAGVVLASGLSGTMAQFAQANKPFEYPKCPEQLW